VKRIMNETIKDHKNPYVMKWEGRPSGKLILLGRVNIIGLLEKYE